MIQISIEFLVSLPQYILIVIGVNFDLIIYAKIVFPYDFYFLKKNFGHYSNQIWLKYSLNFKKNAFRWLSHP